MANQIENQKPTLVLGRKEENGRVLLWNVGIARVALVTCLSFAVVGCASVTELLQGEAGQQVTVKASDQTPPSGITLETQGRTGGEVTLGIGAAPLAINIGRGDTFILRAVAEDSDGIKEVAIWRTTEKTCTNPTTGTAQHVGPGLAGAPLIKNMSSATVGGTATSVRYVSYVVKVDSTCPPIAPRLEVKYVFWAEAMNFSNLLTTSPKLTVTAK